MSRMSLSQYNKLGNRNNRGAQKVEVDNIKFDSTFEANRYIALKECQNAGLISNLERQVKYDIIINDVKVCTYIADFTYTKKDGSFIVEDAKGFRDGVYKLKAKLFYAQEGFPIWESENIGSISRNPILNVHYLISMDDAFPISLLPTKLQKIINK